MTNEGKGKLYPISKYGKALYIPTKIAEEANIHDHQCMKIKVDPKTKFLIVEPCDK
ncbi:MAG: hypothetical protein WED05_02655 [Candidatus Atabeyarchaeum deiterrae]